MLGIVWEKEHLGAALQLAVSARKPPPCAVPSRPRTPTSKLTGPPLFWARNTKNPVARTKTPPWTVPCGQRLAPANWLAPLCSGPRTPGIRLHGPKQLRARLRAARDSRQQISRAQARFSLAATGTFSREHKHVSREPGTFLSQATHDSPGAKHTSPATQARFPQAKQTGSGKPGRKSLLGTIFETTGRSRLQYVARLPFVTLSFVPFELALE